jgi:hypothetical protein
VYDVIKEVKTYGVLKEEVKRANLNSGYTSVTLA